MCGHSFGDTERLGVYKKELVLRYKLGHVFPNSTYLGSFSKPSLYLIK